MVGGAAVADAVQRARRLPGLKVGLHLVLVCGRPVLPSDAVPNLVDREGNFSTRLVRAGFSFFFRPAVRRQLEAEIRAQFEAFSRTGLSLDHVNAHNHMHLHPTVLGLILEVGRAHGLRAVRVPYEPFLSSWKAARHDAARRLATSLFFWPWIALMRHRLGRSKVRCNDFVFGLNDSGDMNRERVLRFLAHLPQGISEFYFHPATRKWPGMDPIMAHYHCEEELEALTAASVKDALRDLHVETIAFGDLGLEKQSG